MFLRYTKNGILCEFDNKKCGSENKHGLCCDYKPIIQLSGAFNCL